MVWRLTRIFCGLRRVPCLVFIGPLGARRRTLKASGKFTTTCHGSFLFIRQIAIIGCRSTNKSRRFEKQLDRCHVFACERSRFVCRDAESPVRTCRIQDTAHSVHLCPRPLLYHVTIIIDVNWRSPFTLQSLILLWSPIREC